MDTSHEGNSAAAKAGDREIIATRVFDAPRELVFRVWTDPRHVEQWWGPRGFTTTTQEMDVRPGGVWRLVMHGPDGVDYRNRIVYLEVVKPEKLVYKHDPEKGSESVNFEVTVHFVAQGEKTKVTMRMVFPSHAAREHVAEKYHAVEGLDQTLDRLREHLGEMVGENSSESQVAARQELILTRIFNAPREVVFKAWTDPGRLKQWWGPKGFTNPVCEVDARAGGMMRIDMRGPDGTVYPMTGEFQEVAPPEMLSFTSGALGADGAPMFEVLTVVKFDAEGGKTRLTLHAKVTMVTASAAPHLAGMREGWSQSLDRLSSLWNSAVEAK